MSGVATLSPPPGPTTEEASAMVGEFMADPVSLFARLRAQYGPIFKLPLAGNDMVFLNDSQLTEKVLRLDFSTFGMSSNSEELQRPLLGRSMPVVADHRYWEELHAAIMPMFTPKMLKGYFEETVAVVAEEVEHLKEMGRSGEAVTMLNFVREGIFTALSRTLFVRGVNRDDIPKLLNWFAQSNVYMNMRYLQGKLADVSEEPTIVAGREALASLDAYIFDLIAYRHANPVDTPEDMLDVLLAANLSDGSPLSDVEIRDNVMALFFGGQETTPSVITWAFGLLSANPDKREKMFAEIDEVLGGRTPTFADLAKLEYTVAVLDEALRLYPPFSYVGREVLEDTELGGYFVAKGTPLGFVGWTIHRNPDDWPEPERFLPERHSKEAKKTRNKCAFMAFGYGQRRCTGERVGRMEGLLMLSMVSQQLILDRVGGGMSPHHIVMAIKPADGQPMTVTERQPALQDA